MTNLLSPAKLFLAAWLLLVAIGAASTTVLIVRGGNEPQTAGASDSGLPGVSGSSATQDGDGQPGVSAGGTAGENSGQPGVSGSGSDAAATSGGQAGVGGAGADDTGAGADDTAASGKPGVSGADPTDSDSRAGSENSNGGAPGVSGTSAIASQTTETVSGGKPGVSGAESTVPRTTGGQGEPVVTNTNPTYPAKVEVPDVEKLTLEIAKRTLIETRLVSSVPNEYARGEDKVLRESIRPGTLVAAGTSIELDPVVALVPNVVGNTLGDAVTRLNDEEGFRVDYTSAAASTSRVTRQRPKAGSYLARGKEVEAICTISVPNVVKLTATDGLARLNSVGLKGGFSPAAVSTDLIYSQSPRAGREVEVGFVVKLVPAVTVPNLINATYQDAQRRLISSNVRGKLAAVGIQPVVDGIGITRPPWVSWQSHKPGTLLPKYDVLTIRMTREVLVGRPPPIFKPPVFVEPKCPECGKPGSKCSCQDLIGVGGQEHGHGDIGGQGGGGIGGGEF